jgi:hypothetical protein
LTKHIHDETLKLSLTLENPKIEITPKIIDNTMLIRSTGVVQPKKNIKVHMTKRRVATKKTSRLQEATRQLYDLEASADTEKPLHIELDLYQMENY